MQPESPFLPLISAPPCFFAVICPLLLYLPNIAPHCSAFKQRLQGSLLARLTRTLFGQSRHNSEIWLSTISLQLGPNTKKSPDTRKGSRHTTCMKNSLNTNISYKSDICHTSNTANIPNILFSACFELLVNF